LIDGSGHLGQYQIGRLPWRFALSRAKERPVSPNHILSRLSPADFGLLEPHLEPTDLPVHRTLEGRNKLISHVYFIEAGFASVVAEGKPSIEVGIIGREGMTGLAIVLGQRRASHATYIQVAGKGQRMSADKLRHADERSSTLHRAMLNYVHIFLRQATMTALANGRSKIEDRLARWLLMAHDRLDGDQLSLTHEFLSLMLGVRRAGVTTSLHELEQKGLIFRNRGIILILDREGLEKQSNGTYVPGEI
jgi:CRP-like cAMP-binding protein